MTAELIIPMQNCYLSTIINFSGYPSGTQFWIGGNDLAHSGTWVWSSGNSIAGYTNFANNNAGTTGHCMEVKADGRWFRSNCHGQDGSHAFIGEKGETRLHYCKYVHTF